LVKGEEMATVKKKKYKRTKNWYEGYHVRWGRKHIDDPTRITSEEYQDVQTDVKLDDKEVLTPFGLVMEGILTKIEGEGLVYSFHSTPDQYRIIIDRR
jgi:hypothetical protein